MGSVERKTLYTLIFFCAVFVASGVVSILLGTTSTLILSTVGVLLTTFSLNAWRKVPWETFRDQ